MDRTVAPGFSRIGPAVRRRLPGWPADPAPGALTGRTVAVTGATSGLGYATAEGLARLGADVRLVARDVQKGDRVKAELEAEVPGAQVAVDRCDVSDLEDVRRFAKELDIERLDVLVHNAGAMPPTRTESPQGHELTMSLHVLGPLLMTELLRPVLSGHDARVVFVTSGGMYGQRLRADDPEFLSGEYSGTTAYARSKRAQVELLPVLADQVVRRRHRCARDAPGLGRHPWRGRVAAALPQADRARCCETLPVGPTPPSGCPRSTHNRRRASSGMTAERARRTCCGVRAPVLRSAPRSGTGLATRRASRHLAETGCRHAWRRQLAGLGWADGLQPRRDRGGAL